MTTGASTTSVSTKARAAQTLRESLSRERLAQTVALDLLWLRGCGASSLDVLPLSRQRLHRFLDTAARAQVMSRCRLGRRACEVMGRLGVHMCELRTTSPLWVFACRGPTRATGGGAASCSRWFHCCASRHAAFESPSGAGEPPPPENRARHRWSDLPEHPPPSLSAVSSPEELCRRQQRRAPLGGELGGTRKLDPAGDLDDLGRHHTRRLPTPQSDTQQRRRPAPPPRLRKVWRGFSPWSPGGRSCRPGAVRARVR